LAEEAVGRGGEKGKGHLGRWRKPPAPTPHLMGAVILPRSYPVAGGIKKSTWCEKLFINKYVVRQGPFGEAKKGCKVVHRTVVPGSPARGKEREGDRPLYYSIYKGKAHTPRSSQRKGGEKKRKESLQF